MRFYGSILGNWVFWLWPSAVLLVVFGMPAPVADGRLIYALSVGINITLYAALWWYLTRLFTAAKRIAISFHSN